MINTKSSKKLKKTDIAGVVLRPNSPEIENIYKDIQKSFKSVNIDILLEKNSALMIKQEEGLDFDTICQNCDFLVAIGGDGTLISAIRRSFKYNLPVLGVHLGTLGFLTDIKLKELPTFLQKLKQDDYRIDKRTMIKGCINNKKFVAFNDIVISRKSGINMLRIDAKKDNKLFNSYYGDGLIISTPTGSTAYNLSSGGPLIHPLTNAFVITPVAPHSLTQRPLVLPYDFKLEFSISDSLGATVIVDGQDTYELSKDDIIKVEVANKKAKLIHRIQRDYFEVLNEKLQWGN